MGRMTKYNFFDWKHFTNKFLGAYLQQVSKKNIIYKFIIKLFLCFKISIYKNIFDHPSKDKNK